MVVFTQAAESKLQSSPADQERIQTLEKDLSQRDSSISELQSQLDSVNSQLSVRLFLFSFVALELCFKSINKVAATNNT